MNNAKRQKKVVPAPLVVVFCIGVGFLAHHFYPVSFLPKVGIVNLLTGIALCSVGLLVGLAGVREFHRHNTPINPFKPASELVTSGVFRYTRHPMYLGFVIIISGIAIAVNSLALLVAAVLEAMLLQVVVINLEDQFLLEVFGSDFENYQQHTRPWI
jgi:protein-S-isoprenylcysteine O-methyltransferase Ste14